MLNLTTKEIEKLEDMVVAILLSETNIHKSREGRGLYFKLETRKLDIFLDYLQRFNLHSQFEYDPLTLEAYVKPSLMLEAILKIWVWDDRVQVIDPSTLRLNAYFIWIGLFGKKINNGVAIPSDLDPSLQYTLIHLFYNQFKTNLYRGNLMQIKPFSPIMLQAINSNRPLEESMELSYLLPKKEKENLKKLVSDLEEERANYAY